MNPNSPTLSSGNAPNMPNMGQPIQPQGGQPQPIQHDFSEGDRTEVMQGGGPTFLPGAYEWTLTHVEYRDSKNPRNAGAKVAIYEGIITKNLSPDGSGEQPGFKRAIVQLESNKFGFYPTMRKFLGALQDIADPNQVRTNGFNDVLNNPATYAGATVRLNVTSRESHSTGRSYNVYDFDGRVPQAEADAFLATNPQLAAIAVPNGTRSQQGLQDPAAYFTA